MLKHVLSRLLVCLSLLAVLAGCLPATSPAGPASINAVQNVTAEPSAPPAATATRAQPTATAGPTGQLVAGQVLWGANPIGGVKVELRTNGCRLASGSQSVAATVTDAQGRYAFLAPPAGDFVLCATWPDGEPSQGATPGVQISAGQSIEAGPATTLKLARPLTMLEPADGSEVANLTALRWQDFPGVTSYHALVANAGTTAVEVDQVVQGASLKLDKSLQPGTRYQLTLLGLNDAQDILAVANVNFATSGIAPTPAGGTQAPEAYGLPPSCQPNAGSALYVEPSGRYCFLYPTGFAVQTSDLGQQNVELAVFGPALDKSADPLRAGMLIEVTDLPAGADLRTAVDGFLKQFAGMPVPPIKREAYTMGGGPAELLQVVPGRTGSRDVFTLNNGGNRLYHFIFTPSLIDFPQATADADALFQMVTGNFAFLTPGPEMAATPAPVTVGKDARTVTYQGVSFSYASGIAQTAAGATVPAEQGGSDSPWWLPVPQHVEIALAGYPLSGTAESPRIIVYPAFEFAGMNQEASTRMAGLQKLLLSKQAAGAAELPFLPLINGKQQMPVGVKFLAFQSGQGVRYLTQYSQGPYNNRELFYTFQGLTGDGRYYVAAILPVSHSLLPADFSLMSPAEREAVRSQLEKYLAESDTNFRPALSDLDALVASITVR